MHQRLPDRRAHRDPAVGRRLADAGAGEGDRARRLRSHHPRRRQRAQPDRHVLQEGPRPAARSSTRARTTRAALDQLLVVPRHRRSARGERRDRAAQAAPRALARLLPLHQGRRLRSRARARARRLPARLRVRRRPRLHRHGAHDHGASPYVWRRRMPFMRNVDFRCARGSTGTCCPASSARCSSCCTRSGGSTTGCRSRSGR